MTTHEEILLEVVTPLNKRIRTHKGYWDKISKEKHIELLYGLEYLNETLTYPDKIYESIKDDTIQLYYRNLGIHTLICVTKVLNGDGFVVTFYQTSKPTPKGKLLWQK